MAATADRASFSGHETFPFRYTWLRKAVDEVSSDGAVFGRDDAMVRFGVGKNMVGSMRHWGMCAGILEEDENIPNNRGRVLRVTEMGRRLFFDGGWDPYLEDPATLWLLHWKLATSRDRATTWSWAFGHMPRPEFSRSNLLGWLMTFVEQHGLSRVSETTVARDVDCFIRTYVAARPTKTVSIEDTVECPLVELNLIREFGTRGHFVLSRREQASLPDAVFVYGLVTFLAGQNIASGTAPLDAIAFSPGAPGRIFSLSESALLERLARLSKHTDGALVLDETAGLRQVLVHRLPDPLDLLADHFRSSQPEARKAKSNGAHR